MNHPDLEILSQILDGELSPTAAAATSSHLEGCATCRRRLERLQRLAAVALDQAGAEARPVASRRRECPGVSGLMGWRDPAIPAAQGAALRRHLETCDACLGEAMAASRLLARLDATPSLAVPRELKARVEALAAKPLAAGELSRLVVRVARAGAELLESHVLAPLRELTLLPAPLAAVRSEASGLSFELRAPDAVITTTVVPSGEDVGVLVAMADEAGRPLVGQRVYLKRHGRALYSARTDDAGTLRLPAITRGLYEVACPGVATAFCLDLRS